MRITFILPTVNMSGGIRVAAIYAQLLQEFGHRVVLVSPPPLAISLKKKLKNLLLHGRWLRNPTQPISHLDGKGLDHHILDRYRVPIDQDVPDADVIIATWWETAEWVSRLGARKGAKVYFIQHHEVVFGLSTDRVRETYFLPLHKVVIANWLQDVMEKLYGDTVVDLVPNAVDHEQFFAPPRAKQPCPTVGFLYHHGHVKGVDIALAAIEQLKRDYPNLRALCFGEKAPSETLPLAEWIEFRLLPPQEQIRDIYAQCDVWLTASRSEGFNLPAMEAMACRTPVVATKTGWPEEAIVDRMNGILVDVDDVDALAEGTRWFLNLAEEDWCQASKAAFASVAESNWTASARLFEGGLQHACERARQQSDTNASN